MTGQASLCLGDRSCSEFMTAKTASHMEDRHPPNGVSTLYSLAHTTFQASSLRCPLNLGGSGVIQMSDLEISILQPLFLHVSQLGASAIVSSTARSFSDEN